MIYTFDRCELDTDGYELRRENQVIGLEPQVFDVLAYLVEHRDRVVPKEELLDQVWQTRFVTESTLTTRIKTARRAVGDDGRRQGVIRTVHGRGYRFVADVELVRPASPSARTPAATVAGRQPQLAALEAALGDAVSGRRRVVVVSGDPGLGKTALVEAFADECRHACRVLTGQCLEYRGPREPYLPVLQALQGAAAQPDGPELVELLAGRAPSWLVQMPWLVPDADFESLRRRVLGSTRERMLREIVEAFEAVAATQPLVVILEDLQWSDPSTLDVVAALGRRRTDARVLLVVTRRTEGDRGRTPGLADLLADLRLHDALEEIALPPLDEDAAARLVAAYCGAEPSADLVGAVHARSGGNPLHMTSLVEDWTSRGLIVTDDGRATPAEIAQLATEVPESLRQLIEQRLARTSPSDRELLESAAVAGPLFSAITVAAGLGLDTEDAEAGCSHLVRDALFVRWSDAHAWADGAVAAGFEFAHDLYQEVLYERVPPARKARLHERIGNRLEVAYGDHAREHAAELAMHFVRGNDVPRAVTYLLLAAEQAVRRSAYSEAHQQLRTGLDLVASLPDSRARQEHELALQSALGSVLIAIHGWAAPAVEQAYERAHQVARDLHEPGEQLASILCGLAALREYRGEYRRSAALLEEVLDFQSGSDDTVHRVASHELLACSSFHQGEFEVAVEHADAGRSLYDAELHLELLASYGENPGVGCHAWGALASWYLGEFDRADDLMARALGLARDADHSFSLANAHEQAAVLHQLRGEPEVVQVHATEAIDRARAQGFGYRVATAGILLGWARASNGRIDQGRRDLEEALTAYRATGARMDLPYFLGLYADACRLAGDVEAGLGAIEEAIALSGDRGYCFDAELHRFRGLLLRDAGAPIGEVVAELQRARKIARRQRAWLVELRATTDRASLDDEKASLAARRDLEHLLESLGGRADIPDAQRARSILGRSPT